MRSQHLNTWSLSVGLFERCSFTEEVHQRRAGFAVSKPQLHSQLVIGFLLEPGLSFLFLPPCLTLAAMIPCHDRLLSVWINPHKVFNMWPWHGVFSQQQKVTMCQPSCAFSQAPDNWCSCVFFFEVYLNFYFKMCL